MDADTAWAAVGAVGTTGAAVAAVGFGLAAERRLSRERKEREKERILLEADRERARGELQDERNRQLETERRQQATRVVAWVEEIDREILDQVRARRVVILNASDRPIFSVMLAGNYPIGVVAPGARHIRDVDPDKQPDLFATLDRGIVQVRFRDSADHWWQRDEDGELKMAIEN